jgi:hypothetical protein
MYRGSFHPERRLALTKTAPLEAGSLLSEKDMLARRPSER